MKHSPRTFVFVLAAGIGLISGEALAIPWFSNASPGNGQTPLPAWWPTPSQYTVPIIVNAFDGIGDVSIGRDDTSPFAAVEVRFNAAYNYGAGTFAAQTPYMFTYRPNLDPIVMQLGLNNQGTGAGGLPFRGDLMEHLTACSVFARFVLLTRSHYGSLNSPANAMQFWIDPAFATPPTASPAASPPNQQFNAAVYHHLEFYKFQLLM